MIRRFVLTLVLLCLPSLAFGQKFNNVVDGSLYPSTGNNIIPPSGGDYAILAWSHVPSTVSGSIEILSVDIIPSVDGVGKASSAYGWYRIDPDTDIRYWWSIIDSSTLYARSGNGVPSWLLDRIQSKLSEKNLGTVQQRAAYIASFKLSNVSFIDTSKIVESIVSLLGPWANIGIGIAIALFGIDLGTRKSKKIAGQAAKEARAAERREINKEIRQDPVAAQFRTHLGNLSSVIRDTYGLHGTDSRTRREARVLFEQAAKDYAAYKKYRGWTS